MSNLVIVNRAGRASPWDRLQKIATITASLLVPIVLAILGAIINQSIKDRELAVQYVEIAVGILSQPRTAENANLHSWAEETLNRHAPVRLNDEALQELREGQPLVAAPAASCDAGFTPAPPDRQVSHVVLRDTQSPSLGATLNVVCSASAQGSYHYVVGLDGTVRSIVPEQHIAWHSGSAKLDSGERVNPVSIGIGIVHVSSASNWLKLPQDHAALGRDYPEAQRTALFGLLREILERHDLEPNAILTAQDISAKPSDLHGGQLAEIRSILSR